MARGNRRSGPQRPVPGFRPGKEPANLRKQRAMQQLGGEVSGSQQRLMELFADRTPREARALIRRWWIGLLAGAILLAVLGGVLFLWWQVHRKRGDLEAVADMVSGGKTGGGSHGSRKRRK